MVPPIGGHNFPTLGIGWILLLLGVSVVTMFVLGTRTFMSRVVT
jgi:hypothetical protein